MTKKILLADDSITIQKVVELTFSYGDYEVIATNNGAKAIQKLSEVRPDIILSDIIMPEKNGYEVCEYVKSHPEYRNIPVILLTGTFEPFDPDRAEKAGCDAVVTKPFESQSLIHKVEELIEQSRASAGATPAAPAAAALAFSSFEDTVDPMSEDGGGSGDAFGASSPAPEAPAMPSFADSDAFGAPAPEPKGWPEPAFELGSAPAAAAPSFELPTNDSPFGSEAASEEESPLDQTFPSPRAMQPPGFTPPTKAAADHGDEIFGGSAPKSSDAFSMPLEQPSPAPSFPAPSFNDEPPASPFGRAGETLAFPKMSFDDLQRLQQGTTPHVEEEPAPFGGGLESIPFTPPAPPQAAPPEPEPSFGGRAGETLAFPKMNFDDLQRMQDEAAASAPADDPWSTPAATAEPADVSWSPKSPAASEFGGDSFSGSSSPFALGSDALPFDRGNQQDLPPQDLSPQALSPEEEPQVSAPESPAEAIESAPSWSMTSAESITPKADSMMQPASEAEPEQASTSNFNGELSDAQIEKIARRVVEMLSDTVVRNIAWEVIPDVAASVVKERIKQLESE